MPHTLCRSISYTRNNKKKLNKRVALVLREANDLLLFQFISQYFFEAVDKLGFKEDKRDGVGYSFCID